MSIFVGHHRNEHITNKKNRNKGNLRKLGRKAGRYCFKRSSIITNETETIKIGPTHNFFFSPSGAVDFLPYFSAFLFYTFWGAFPSPFLFFHAIHSFSFCVTHLSLMSYQHSIAIIV